MGSIFGHPLFKRKDASNGMGSTLVSRNETKREVSSFLYLFFYLFIHAIFWRGQIFSLILKAHPQV